jgi:hypothetical protein
MTIGLRNARLGHDKNYWIETVFCNWLVGFSWIEDQLDRYLNTFLDITNNETIYPIDHRSV